MAMIEFADGVSRDVEIHRDEAGEASQIEARWR